MVATGTTWMTKGKLIVHETKILQNTKTIFSNYTNI